MKAKFKSGEYVKKGLHTRLPWPSFFINSVKMAGACLGRDFHDSASKMSVHTWMCGGGGDLSVVRTILYGNLGTYADSVYCTLSIYI